MNFKNRTYPCIHFSLRPSCRSDENAIISPTSEERLPAIRRTIGSQFHGRESVVNMRCARPQKLEGVTAPQHVQCGASQQQELAPALRSGTQTKKHLPALIEPDVVPYRTSSLSN